MALTNEQLDRIKQMSANTNQYDPLINPLGGPNDNGNNGFGWSSSTITTTGTGAGLGGGIAAMKSQSPKKVKKSKQIETLPKFKVSAASSGKAVHVMIEVANADTLLPSCTPEGSFPCRMVRQPDFWQRLRRITFERKVLNAVNLLQEWCDEENAAYQKAEELSIQCLPENFGKAV